MQNGWSSISPIIASLNLTITRSPYYQWFLNLNLLFVILIINGVCRFSLQNHCIVTCLTQVMAFLFQACPSQLCKCAAMWIQICHSFDSEVYIPVQGNPFPPRKTSLKQYVFLKPYLRPFSGPVVKVDYNVAHVKTHRCRIIEIHPGMCNY